MGLRKPRAKKAKRPRPRPIPIQGELDLPPPIKLDKNGQRRGGVREGAGRPPSSKHGGKRVGSPHKARPALCARHPVHATLRVVEAVGWLRRMDVYRAIRHALACVAAKHHAFRIVHLSIQGTHLHVLCEAEDKLALGRGLQGFQVSAAKAIHRAMARRRRAGHGVRPTTSRVRVRGTVFSDRYHAEVISSVQQTRNALCYVLNNWRRHAQDRGGVGLFGGRVDLFSSGIAFEGWRAAIETWTRPTDVEPLPVCRPQTWLLAHGWKRAKPIGAFEKPGPRPRAVDSPRLSSARSVVERTA